MTTSPPLPKDGFAEDDRTVLKGRVRRASPSTQLRRPQPASRRASGIQAPPAVAAPPTEQVLALPRARASASLQNPLFGVTLPLFGLLSRVRLGEIDVAEQDLKTATKSYISKLQDIDADRTIPEHLLQLAKFFLAAMTDDVCRARPGFDAATYRPLTRELFGVESGSQRFFGYLKTAIDNPAEYAPLLELMFVCLALGYEGRYRDEPGGKQRVAEKRDAAADALGSLAPAGTALSPKWLPVLVHDRLKRRVAPLWLIACLGAVMVLVLYATFASSIGRDLGVVQEALRAPQRLEAPRIARVAIPVPPPPAEAEPTLAPLPVLTPPPPPEPTQLERITQALGSLDAEIEIVGDYIAVRLGDVLRFPSGGTLPRDDLGPVIAPIAAVLNEERGQIVVEGHSDNIPLNGLGVFKTNEELSRARAQAVADELAPMIDDPSRISILGVGPARPIRTDNSGEARNINRRVEILLLREGRSG